MENVRSRVNMSFVTSNSAWGDHAVKHDRTVERKIASPLYDGHVFCAALNLRRTPSCITLKLADAFVALGKDLEIDDRKWPKEELGY